MAGIEGLEAFTNVMYSDADEWTTGDSPPSQLDFDIFNTHPLGPGHDGQQPQPPPHRHHTSGIQLPLASADLSQANGTSANSSSGSSKQAQDWGSNQANSLDTPMTDLGDSGDHVDYQQFLEFDDGGDKESPKKTVDPTKLSVDSSWDGHLDSPESSFFKNEIHSPARVHTTTASSPTTRDTSAAVLPTGSYAGTGAVPRRHQKAISQYSLTKSMPGLSIKGSREVSPTGNFVFSQTASPSTAPNNSPPTAFDFGFGPSMNQIDINNIHGLPSAEPSSSMVQLPGQVAPLAPFAPIHQGMGFASFGATLSQAFDNSSWEPAPPLTFRLELADPARRKSRVETQIRVGLVLDPMPPGFKRLRLPKHTIGKSKFFKSDESAPDMLELHVMLVRTSTLVDPNKMKWALARAAEPPTDEERGTGDKDKAGDDEDLRICQGCITRERKRAGRKKNHKEPANEELWHKLEPERIILINDYEIQQWKDHNTLFPCPIKGRRLPMGPGHLTLPLRLCCYCRHHDEKQGFRVVFTIKDWQGNLIAQNISDSIMITDDHKTAREEETANQDETPAQPPRSATAAHPPSSSPQNVFPLSSSTPNLHALQTQASTASSSAAPPHLQHVPVASAFGLSRNLSRPPSPSGLGAPMAKKRKGSGSKIPNELAMTRLETSGAPPSVHLGAQPPSTAISPFTPNRSSYQLQGPVGGSILMPQALPLHGLSNIDSNDRFFQYHARAARRESREPDTVSQGYSVSPSNQTSRASSPNTLGFSPPPTLPLRLLQATLPPAPAPMIHKIVPAEGSKSGAYEVSILGIGFQPGLEVMFGDTKAIATTFWGDRSLLAVVPAAHTAGIVNITIRQPNGQPMAIRPGHNIVTFKYNDDDEKELLRTALAVLSKKWQSPDIQGVARHIINSDQWNNSEHGAGRPTGSSGPGFNGFVSGQLTLEMQLLKVCELVDMDDSATKAHWNLRKKTTGQTMLHLASAMGFQRLVAGLLARGATPDVRDNAGYTPMHLAALNKHPEIVRRLVHAGADSTLRTLSGLTPAEMAPGSIEVFAATRSLQRHSRSRSATSLHSHASSSPALRSLWEPADNNVLAAEYKVDSPESNSESLESSQPETSEDEDEDEDDVEEAEWLDMRRGSVHSRRTQDVSNTPIDPSTDHLVPAAMASPAIATLREQLTHLQHFVSQQFPTSINMPNPLPDYYRPYFNTGALQRISALVPSIGVRPGSPNDGSGSKEIEGKWWDLTSLIPNYNVPPPAYEDIYPQKDLDTKQATAAGAAADAEADAKCAALFDQLSVMTEEATPSTSKSVKQSAAQTATSSGLAKSTTATRSRELPRILQIGPKNKIPTKEEQEVFRREHEKVQKPLSSDKKLFWVWIPILSLMLLAMISSWFPEFFDSLVDKLGPGANVVKRFRAASSESRERVIGWAA